MNSLKKLNYYQRLGVDQSANTEEIRHSFRTLAQSFHPDAALPGDGPEKAEFFKLITEAYHVLLDPHKRLSYDTGLKSRIAQSRTATVIINRDDEFFSSKRQLSQLKCSSVPTIRYIAQPPVPRKKVKRRKKSRKRRNSLILAYTGLMRLLGVGSY